MTSIERWICIFNAWLAHPSSGLQLSCIYRVIFIIHGAWVHRPVTVLYEMPLHICVVCFYSVIVLGLGFQRPKQCSIDGRISIWICILYFFMYWLNIPKCWIQFTYAESKSNICILLLSILCCIPNLELPSIVIWFVLYYQKTALFRVDIMCMFIFSRIKQLV